MKNTILYLIGYPGTGKYTIATEICRQQPRFKLVDNHLSCNPLFALLDVDGIKPLPAGVWDHIDTIRQAVLATMRDLSPPDFSFVLTNYLQDPEDRDMYQQVLDVADARKALFVPVRLTIDPTEHKRRIVGADRALKMKHQDPEAVAKYHGMDDLMIPEHDNLLSIDVSCLSACQVAEQIQNHLHKLA